MDELIEAERFAYVAASEYAALLICLFSLAPFAVPFSELEATWRSCCTLLKASIDALFTMLPTEPTKLLVLGIFSKLALFCFTLVKLDGEVPTRMNELLAGFCS